MKLKTTFLTLLKLLFAALLLLWLDRSGQLDFRQLNKFVVEPDLALATVAYFVFGPLILTTLRWKLLLEAADYVIGWKRAFQLQLTGFFFNTVMPGAVGGDLVKTAYVIRDNPTKSKTLAMMTVVLDRIIGLSGLFFVGWLLFMINFQQIIAEKKLLPLISLMSAISCGFVVFFATALYHYKGSDPILRLLQLRIPGFKVLLKLYSALRTYRYARGSILRCLLYSFMVQIASLMLFYFMTIKVLGTAPPFGPIATIFPMGILTTALPITPGGLGVGHVAFDRLFHMIGLDHGATVFNLYVLSQLFLNLFGVFTYLGLKKSPEELPLARNAAHLS